MPESILTSVKKTLGLAETNTVFDPDIVMHINSVFADLNQLGVGPADGFAITDETEVWETFLEDDVLMNSVKSYMFLRVKMLHDPYTIGRVIESAEKQIAKSEWRIMTHNMTPDLTGYSVVDGGSP